MNLRKCFAIKAALAGIPAARFILMFVFIFVSIETTYTETCMAAARINNDSKNKRIKKL